MGSGSGRCLKGLAEKGTACTGIEISEGMIKKAQERLSGIQEELPKPLIINGDIATTQLDKKFDFVIYPYSILLELGSRDHVLTAIKNGYRHLSNNGVMIIDNGYYGDWKQDNIVKFLKTIPGTLANGNCTVNIFEARRIEKTTKEIFNYIFIDQIGSNRSLSRTYFEIRGRFIISTEDMNAMLTRVGFMPIEAYRNYSDQRFEDNGIACRQLWICRKDAK